MNFSLKGYRTVILNAIVLIGALLELVGVIDGLTGGAFTLSGWGAGLIRSEEHTSEIGRASCRECLV